MFNKIQSEFNKIAVNYLINNLDNNRRMLLLIIYSVVLIFFVNIEVKSQQTVDSRGKEFLISYLPNFHSWENETYSLDSLYIYISSEKVCVVTIEATDKNGNTTSRNVNITNVNQVYSESYYHGDYEIAGINYYSAININNNDAEKPMPQHFRVTSTEDVSLYASSYALYTTDAFMVLPVSALGTEYMIMSYNSDYNNTNLNNLSSNSTPSQYIILATEDNTQINIKNKVATTKNDILEYNIKLDRGESYLVQATYKVVQSDLTGSVINSDKAIAVFSGHQRTAIPFNYPVNNKSRDILVEQLNPVILWGRNALVTPLPVPRRQFNISNDIFRVLALRDNSEIYLNDRLVKLLNRGEFYESFIDSSYYIKSNSPISVAVYKKTSTDGSQNIDSYWGDPFMALIPPIEQFHNVYRSINLQIKTDNGFFTENNFFDHFITIYVNQKFASSVKIDGQVVDQTIFKNVGNSEFMYGNFKVSEGTHEVLSDDKLGIIISGYGPANSYGYLGGISTIPQDYFLPQVFETYDCYQIDIIATDTLTFDRGIGGIEVVESDNIELIIPGIDLPTPIYEFSLRLIDKTQSGTIEIKIKEANGGWIRKIYNISSKELILASVDDLKDGTSNKEYNINYDSPQNREKCFQIRVENPTKEDIEINTILSKINKIKIKNISNKIVPRGSFSLIDFCIETNTNEIGSVIDSLFLVTNCNTQLLSTVVINVDRDNSEPQITENISNCNQRTISVQENGIFDRGLKSYTINQNINCEIILNNFTDNNIVLNINQIDPTQDAIINISFLDSADNEIVYDKVIQGFTLSFIETNKTNFEYTDKLFKFKAPNVTNCIEIPIYNYGRLPFIINATTFKNNNNNFSVPLSQLPLEIMPNETQNLVVCFYPLVKDSELTDSLTIDFNCNDYYIGLNSEELPDLTVITKCGISYTISLINSQINLTTFYPNPTSNNTNIEITSDKESSLKIRLIDLLGNVVYEESKKINAGYNLLNYNLGKLYDGQYNAILEIEGQEIFEKISIIK